MSHWLTRERHGQISLLNKYLNIVIVKESEIGRCMWLHFNVNLTGFIPTLTCQQPFLQTLINGLFSCHKTDSISEPLNVKYLKIILASFGCLFSHYHWHDECSLHQYCMNNSPDIFFVSVVLTDSSYFPCFCI